MGQAYLTLWLAQAVSLASVFLRQNRLTEKKNVLSPRSQTPFQFCLSISKTANYRENAGNTPLYRPIQTQKFTKIDKLLICVYAGGIL